MHCTPQTKQTNNMSSSPEEESLEVKAIELHLESAKHQVTITKEHANWANYQLDESKRHLKDVQRMLKEAKIRVSLDQTEEEEDASQNEQLQPNSNDIILSLHNENYRSIMFSSFIQLAKEGDSKKKEIAIQIYNYFKCNMDGEDSGKFYKVYSNGKSYFEVDDGAALQSKLLLVSLYICVYFVYLYGMCTVSSMFTHDMYHVSLYYNRD